MVGSFLMQPGAAQQSKSTGLRLNHVGIYAKDYDETMRFYTQTIGLKEAFTVKDAAGKPTLTYLQITKDTFLEIAPATGDRAVGLSHIGIWPENLAATVALLRQRGVKVDDPLSAFIVDDYPDAGNTAWTGRVGNGGAAPVGFTVYAICIAVSTTG